MLIEAGQPFLAPEGLLHPVTVGVLDSFQRLNILGPGRTVPPDVQVTAECSSFIAALGDRHRPPRPQDVDQTDAVGEGTRTPLWTYDTTTDSGPHDVELCATDAGWLTGAYAGQVRAHRPRSVPGAQWREWAGHRARTTVAVKKTADAAKPPDTGTEAWRQWTVTATPEGERTVG